MPIIVRWENEDVKFIAQTNFSIERWKKYFDKDVIISILRKSSKYIDDTIRKRFIDEKDPKGHRWKKLDALTIKYKKGRTGILKYTKKLMRNIISSFYMNELTVSVPLDYAIIHQKGAKIRTTKKQDMWMWFNLFNKKGPIYPKGGREILIPVRPFLGFNEKNKEAIRDIISKEFKKSERMGTGAI